MIPLDLYPYLLTGLYIILITMIPLMFALCGVTTRTKRWNDVDSTIEVYNAVLGVWSIIVMAACIALWYWRHHV